jgi:hypothetical protein
MKVKGMDQEGTAENRKGIRTEQEERRLEKGKRQEDRKNR